MTDTKGRMNIDDSSYYDEAYFVTGGKEMTDSHTGEKKKFGYQGCDWSGNYHVITGLLRTFKGELGSVLEAGAGQGSFTDYAVRMGLKARGYDYSQWAVDHAIGMARDNLFLGDVTAINEADTSWDMIFCSDVVEHIRKSQIQKVVDEFWRITRKWIFLQFPVVSREEDVFNAEIHGEEHPLYTHFMISKHLNMELRSWWQDLFESKGFKIRDDLCIDFRRHTPRAVIVNWENIMILEKV